MSEQDGPSETKSPVEQAVDVFVYAPIGLLFEGASLLPQLIEKGRNQVTVARMMGKFAVEQGRGEALKAAGRLGDQAAGLLEFLGDTVAPVPRDTGATPASPTVASNGPVNSAPTTVPVAEPAPAIADGDPGPDVTALAIPDYDGLSASHVVNRLAGLSDRELEAVRRYEAANRGRKTILSKVAQLQSA